MNIKARSAGILAAALGIGLITGPAAAAGNTDQTQDMAPSSGVCVADTSTPAHHYNHYRGQTAIPSATVVTSSGLEAQCILAYLSKYHDEIPHPGPYDGIFGPQSQASMGAFQNWANRNMGADLVVDGLPGPASWPYLRGGDHTPF